MEQTPVNEMSYDDAVKELQTILAALHKETISIDQLTDSIKRASDLLKSCNQRLVSTKEEVDSVIEKLGLGEKY